MFNKNGRTDAEEAVANQAGGIGNQVKGSLKEAWGAVTGDHHARREGTKDRLKGRVQEAYGNVKEKEVELEEDLKDIGSGRV